MKALIYLLLMLSPLWVSAAEVFTVKLSTMGYNRLVFPEPYSKIVFTKESPVNGEIIPLGDKRQVLLRLKHQSTIPAQATIQLVSGETFSLIMLPHDTLEPTVWRYQGAPDSLAKETKMTSRPDDKSLANIFVSAALGKVPEGFDKTKIPAPMETGFFLFNPVSRFKSPSYVLTEVEVYSSVFTGITERDLFVDTWVAGRLENDVVGPNQPTRLFYLETNNER